MNTKGDNQIGVKGLFISILLKILCEVYFISNLVSQHKGKAIYNYSSDPSNVLIFLPYPCIPYGKKRVKKRTVNLRESCPYFSPHTICFLSWLKSSFLTTIPITKEVIAEC